MVPAAADPLSPLPLFQLRYVSSVFSGGQRCAALSDRNMMGFIASLHELASSERRFYWKLCNIKTQIMGPLLELGEAAGRLSPQKRPRHPHQNLFSASPADALGSALGKVTLGLLQTLAGRFSLLCRLTGQHASSLSANVRRSRSVRSLLLLDHPGLFLDSYYQ